MSPNDHRGPVTTTYVYDPSGRLLAPPEASVPDQDRPTSAGHHRPEPQADARASSEESGLSAAVDPIGVPKTWTYDFKPPLPQVTIDPDREKHTDRACHGPAEQRRHGEPGPDRTCRSAGTECVPDPVPQTLPDTASYDAEPDPT